MSSFDKNQTRKKMMMKRKAKTKATAKKMTMMTTKTTKVVEEALDSLPQEFRSRIRNVAVLVEDMPPNQPSPHSGQQRRLLLGLFHGVPTTKKSIFDLPTGPDHIVLYQKNIEAVCSSEAGVRKQIRLTVIHELGHYFGMDENQLKDV
jgi:predicted Zn-dependent protease with MMP-like domain